MTRADRPNRSFAPIAGFGLAAALALAGTRPAAAEPIEYGYAPDIPGVELSQREKAAARVVVAPDGERYVRVGSGGIPFLFGLGDAYGRASGRPLRNGVTTSVILERPAGGLVPGQEGK